MWSIACIAKFHVINSTIGLKPFIAAPIANPVKPASVIVENAFDYLDAEPLRFSGKDIPLPYAENLEKLALPSAEVIVKKCLEIC